MVWDLEGREDYIAVTDSYLRGMAGYFLVADVTRPETMDSVREIKRKMRGLFAELPSVLLANKSDLRSTWRFAERDAEDFRSEGIDVLVTSAKDGSGVEGSFTALARDMLERDAVLGA